MGVVSSNYKFRRNVIVSDLKTCRPVEESIIFTLLVVSIETTAVGTVSLTSRIECPIIFTCGAVNVVSLYGLELSVGDVARSCIYLLLPLFQNKRTSVLCPRVIPMILLGFHP